MKTLKWNKQICLLFLLTFSYVGAEEIVIRDSHGDSFIVNVAPNETFLNVIEHVKTLSCEQPEFCIDFSLNSIKIMPAAATSMPRNYNAPVNRQEKQDISFIVNTLAKASLVTLLRQKGDLERAGDRINHVHPLRFLMTVFTDEELKVNLYNIRTRSWVWDDFMKGLRDSLSEEYSRGNMREEYVSNFSSILAIKPEIIIPYIQGARWDDLVDELIEVIPRKGDSDRYDM